MAKYVLLMILFALKGQKHIKNVIIWNTNKYGSFYNKCKQWHNKLERAHCKKKSKLISHISSLLSNTGLIVK